MLLAIAKQSSSLGGSKSKGAVGFSVGAAVGCGKVEAIVVSVGCELFPMSTTVTVAATMAINTHAKIPKNILFRCFVFCLSSLSTSSIGCASTTFRCMELDDSAVIVPSLVLLCSTR